MKDGMARLKKAAQSKGLAFEPVSPEVLAMLGRLLGHAAGWEALLAHGWPERAIQVGGAHFLPPLPGLMGRVASPGEGIFPLQTDSPTPLAVRWSDGALVRLQADAPPEVLGQAAEAVADLALWLEVVQPSDWVAMDGEQALTRAAVGRLSQRLGLEWRQRPVFARVETTAEVTARLQVALRRSERIVKVCGVVCGLAPILGYFLGNAVQPPQPWVGVAVAALVVGGVPSLLLASALRDGVRLRRALAVGQD